MATATLKTISTAGRDAYFRIYNDAGEVFDFDDDSFKAIGSATTPYIVATELAGVDGTGRSGYSAAIDLDDINANPRAREFFFLAFDNGTPANGDVSFTDPRSFTVQAGQLGEQPIVCMVDGAFTTNAGEELRLIAWLERGGQRVALSAGSCTVTVREQGAGVDLFSETSAAPESTGDFEIEVETPGFTDDRLYRAFVAITVGGETFTTEHTIPVQSAGTVAP